MKIEMDDETIQAINRLHADCGLPERTVTAKELVAEIFGGHRGNREHAHRALLKGVGSAAQIILNRPTEPEKRHGD